MTVNELKAKAWAKAYAETINGPANGWGQHVHPTLGRTDYIMARVTDAVGHEEGQKLIDEAMAAYHAA